MKIEFNCTPEELTEAILLFKEAFGIKDTTPLEDNKYTQAVGKAVEEHVTVVDKPKRKPGPKAKIDRGKVGALHTAGWSVPKIADEMRCSEQTVKNIIKELEATA